MLLVRLYVVCQYVKTHTIQDSRSMYIYINCIDYCTCVHKNPVPSLPISNAEIANAFSFDCILFHWEKHADFGIKTCSNKEHT